MRQRGRLIECLVSPRSLSSHEGTMLSSFRLGPYGSRIDNLLSMLGAGLLTPPAAGPKVSRLWAASARATFSGPGPGKSVASFPRTSPRDAAHFGIAGRSRLLQVVDRRRCPCRRGLCSPIPLLQVVQPAKVSL